MIIASCKAIDADIAFDMAIGNDTAIKCPSHNTSNFTNIGYTGVGYSNILHLTVRDCAEDSVMVITSIEVLIVGTNAADGVALAVKVTTERTRLC